MSREIVDRFTERLSGLESRITDSKGYSVLRSEYDWIVLVVATIFMFSTRITQYTQVFSEEGVLITNSEGMYNARHAEYIANNWPFVLNFDPYIDYPIGTNEGGSVFDFIVGTLALLIDLGSVTPETVQIVLVILTVGFAVLSLIPLYHLTHFLFNKATATITVILFTLIPSTFFEYSTLGEAGSHTFELFLILTALYGIVRTYDYCRSNALTKEVFFEVDYGFFRPITQYVVMAIVALTILSTLNPSVYFMLVAGFTAFVFVYTLLVSLAADSPEPGLYATVLLWVPAVLISGITTLVSTEPTTVQITTSVLSVFMLVTSVGFALLSRPLEQERFLTVEHYQLPVAVFGTAFVAGAIGYLSSSLRQLFTEGVAVVFSTELQFVLLRDNRFASLQDVYGGVASGIFQEYGVLFVAAGLGVFFIILAALRQSYRRQVIAPELVVLLTAGVFAVGGIFQIWYNIYFTAFVAMLAGYGIYELVNKLEIVGTSVTDYKGYQVIGIIFIVVILVPVLLYPVGGTVLFSADVSSASSVEYDETGEWLAENTASPGSFDERPVTIEDGYGVMNHWGMGYELAYHSERPVMSSQVQQTTQGTSAYLLANPDETDPQSEFIEYTDGVDDVDDRYVVIDWETVAGESRLTDLGFSHPETLHTDYSQPIYTPTGQFGFTMYTDRYYESLAPRLYHYHGSEFGQQPIVVQTEQNDAGFMSTPEDIRQQESIQEFDSIEEAEEFARTEGGQIGGIGINPTHDVNHIENYRLVHTSSQSVLETPEYTQFLSQLATFHEELQIQDVLINDSAAKTFERVEGGEIQGSGAVPNQEVTAAVELEDPNSENNILYQASGMADEDGEFSITVPYSTTGYESFGADEGYGDVDVRASGPFVVFSEGSDGTIFAGEVHVTEGQVLGEDEVPATITLEEFDEDELPDEEIDPEDEIAPEEEDE